MWPISWGETRKTESGDRVVWDLILLSPDSYCWRRTDWPPISSNEPARFESLPLGFRRRRSPAGRRRILRGHLHLEVSSEGGAYEHAHGSGPLPRAMSDPRAGGKEDPMTPIECQVDIATALTAHLVRFERFPGCGHGVLPDAPDRAMAVIRDFIVH
jgi:pimeloyl-ACP methyl ester carboxylesterase